MKKRMLLIVVLFLIAIVMAGCGDDKKTDTKNDVDKVENAEDQKDGNAGSKSEKEGEENGKTEETAGGNFNAEVKDQLDLGIGDTGTFDTTLGTYDITLISAKIEDEINGESSELDKFIIIDFVVKNTSQETQNLEEILYPMEVTDDLNGSGFPDGSEYFDGFEKLSGPIEPNEEKKGRFVMDIYDADQFYLRNDPGDVAAGGSNQVIWTINADEAK